MNLDPYVAGCVDIAIFGMKTLDFSDLEERARDAVSGEAENACIYTANCLDIITRYESVVDVSDYLCGEGPGFKSDQWQEAMTRYAYYVADAYISAELASTLEMIEEAAEGLLQAAQDAGYDDDDAPVVGLDCPHGWARHESEDADGVHLWLPGELEGCKAVAVQVAGLWLSHTWTAGEAL